MKKKFTWKLICSINRFEFYEIVSEIRLLMKIAAEKKRLDYGWV